MDNGLARAQAAYGAQEPSYDEAEGLEECPRCEEPVDIDNVPERCPNCGCGLSQYGDDLCADEGPDPDQQRDEELDREWDRDE